MAENILNLNDDCLMLIMKKLELIDLCAVAESCKRLKYIAGETFMRRRHKTYGIPHIGIQFKDHRRILKIFGSLVTAAALKMNVFDLKTYGMPHIGIQFKYHIRNITLNNGQMITAFKWLERYCKSLQEISIFSRAEIDLPPSAIRLMPKLRKIEFMLPSSDKMVRKALWKCSELVELNLDAYNGRFHWQDHRFPHLQKLSHRVRLGAKTDFNKIETFFQHHTKLTDLNTQFVRYHGIHPIDFSFLKHLPDLKKLNFILVGAPVVGIEAFACIKNLQEFCVDSTSDQRTDALILENLASVDSLATLILGFPDVSHLVSGIGRFKKLSKLEISSDNMNPRDKFDNANISSLALIDDSALTELEVSCMKLLEPESIVNVVRKLSKLKTVKLYCEVELTESMCQNLANICSSQSRNLVIYLYKFMVGDMDFDFNYIEKFNKKFGAFVEVIVRP